MAVDDVSISISVTKKGTEAIDDTADKFQGLEKQAKSTGEALSWTGEQVQKASNAMRAGFGGGMTGAMLKDIQSIAAAGLSGAAAIEALGQTTKQRFGESVKASKELKAALASVPPELQAMDKALQVAAADSAKFSSSVDSMAKALTGRNLKQEMGALAVAIEKIGGASKITAPEFDKLQEKIQKYKAAGLSLPGNLAGLELQGPQLPAGFKPPAAADSSSMAAGFAGGAAVAGLQAAGQLIAAGLRLAKEAAIELFDAIVTGAERAISAAVEFEKVMTRIKVLSNSSAADMALYNDEVVKMATAVGIGPQKLAEGLERITSLGKTGTEALDILRQAAQLSSVGMGEVGTIATSITGAVNSYGAANLSAAQAADILTAVVREGGAEANAYAGTLGRIAPLAANLGIRFADLGANLAAFTRLGVSASEATTGMSSFMTALLKPTADGTLALKNFGGEALNTINKVKEAIKNEGLAQTMVALMQAFKGHDDALAALLPNVRALRDAMATAGSQGEEYLAIQERIRNSAGDADKAFAETAKTAEFQFNSIKASVETAALAIGQALLPAAMKAADFVKSDLLPIMAGLVKVITDNKDAITNGAAKAFDLLRDAMAGSKVAASDLNFSLVTLLGTSITDWASRNAEGIAKLSLALLNMTAGGRAAIDAMGGFTGLLGAGRASRNKQAEDAMRAPADYVTAPTGDPFTNVPGLNGPTPYAGMGGAPTSPETLASWTAAAEAQKKLAEAGKQSNETFAEMKARQEAAAAAAKSHEKAVSDLVKQMEGLGTGNKDVEAIEEALTRGGGAAEASATFVHKFGKELKEASEAGVTLTDEGVKLVALYNDQLNAAQLNKDLDKAAEAADRAFKASEKAINGLVKEMQGFGTGKHDIANIEAALKRLPPAAKMSDAAVQKFGKDLLEAAADAVPLSDAAEDVVAHWLALRESNAMLAHQKQLIAGLGPTVKQLATQYAELAEAIRKQQSSPEGLNPAQRLASIKQLEAMRDAIKAAGGDTSKLDAQLKGLGANAGLQRAMEMFAQIAQIAGRIGDEIGGWGGDALKTVGKAGEAYKSGQAAVASGSKAQVAVAAAGTAMDIYQDNKHNMSAGSATLNGAARGAAFGAAAGPYGMIIGAIVGGVIGFFSGSKFRALVHDASGILGTEVSQQLAEKIEKTMKTLKLKDVKSAVLLNLDEAITESGKAASTFAPQINDLIKGIADKSIPAKEGMAQLSKSFALLSEEAAKSKTASLALFSVMKQARESKVMTDEMKASITEAVHAMADAANQAFGSLSDDGVKGGIKIMSDESAKAQATIFALVWAQTVAEVGLTEAGRLLKDGFSALMQQLELTPFAEAAKTILAPIAQQMALSTSEAFAGASDAAAQFADILKNAINTAMPLTIEQVRAFGQVSQDAFTQARDAAIETGMSAEEASRNALLAIAPLLQQQIQASKAYGIPLDENTQKLVDQAKAAGIAFADDPMTKAADAMMAVAEALAEVFDLTLKTTDGFREMGNAANNVHPPNTNGGGGDNGGPPPKDNIPGYASGGIFRGPSSGGLVMLHGNEAVLTLPQLYGEMAAIVSQATAELVGGGSGGGSSVYAPVVIGDVYVTVEGGASEMGLEEFGHKLRAVLVHNAGEARTDLDERMDRRAKALVR